MNVVSQTIDEWQRYLLQNFNSIPTRIPKNIQKYIIGEIQDLSRVPFLYELDDYSTQAEINEALKDIYDDEVTNIKYMIRALNFYENGWSINDLINYARQLEQRDIYNQEHSWKTGFIF